MANSTIHTEAFKGSFAHLNGQSPIRITKMDIARGLLSIGKTHWLDHLKRPDRTILDFVHHWSGLQSYLRDFPRLRITQRYADLDATDKMTKSYRIGMGVAKIVAERKLNILFLQNVAPLIKSGAVTLTTGTNEQGDMVGLDNHRQWHVVEAKGRTNRAAKKDKDKAKAQAEKIATINGIAPITKSYCITQIYTSGSEVLFVDPDELPALPTTLEIDEEKLIFTYYDKIFGGFYNREPNAEILFERFNLRFQLFQLQGTRFLVGLPDTFLKDLSVGKTGFRTDLEERQQIFSNFSRLPFFDVSFGRDGIVLIDERFLAQQNALGFTRTRLEQRQIRLITY